MGMVGKLSRERLRDNRFEHEPLAWLYKLVLLEKRIESLLIGLLETPGFLPPLANACFRPLLMLY